MGARTKPITQSTAAAPLSSPIHSHRDPPHPPPSVLGRRRCLVPDQALVRRARWWGEGAGEAGDEGKQGKREEAGIMVKERAAHLGGGAAGQVPFTVAGQGLFAVAGLTRLVYSLFTNFPMEMVQDLPSTANRATPPVRDPRRILCYHLLALVRALDERYQPRE